jgi:hypothetical protein
MAAPVFVATGAWAAGSVFATGRVLATGRVPSGLCAPPQAVSRKASTKISEKAEKRELVISFSSLERQNKNHIL